MPRRLVFALLALSGLGIGTTPARAASPLPTPGPFVDHGVEADVAAGGSARVMVVYREARRDRAGAPRTFDGGRVVARSVNAADLARLRRDDAVARVIVDHLRRVQTDPVGWPLGPGYLDAYGPDQPGDGSGQLVAVVDTGVLAVHAYFTNNSTATTRVLGGACFATNVDGTGACPNGQTAQTGAGAGEPCTGAVDCMHGTHVAGIVAGRDDSRGLQGVAPAAAIMPIRVFNVSAGVASAYDSDVLAAMYYVYEHRDGFGLPLAAVNLSLGGALSTTACDADPSMGLYVDVIGRLRRAGIATTIAEGNDFTAGAISFPACVSDAIAVGATMEGDTGEVLAPYSDRLNGVTDFVAPGDRIVSSISLSPTAYASDSGTSMAAPMLAGAFASIRSAVPAMPHNGAGFDAIVAALDASADPIGDGAYAYLRPDIKRAVEHANTSAPGDTSTPNDPPPITGRFVPVTPVRLVDTRQGAGRRVPAGSLSYLDFDNLDVLPAGAAAAALNVTVVAPSASGFLTVFPCHAGSGLPTPRAPDTSNLNFGAGRTVANLAVVGISAASQVCFQGNADMDVIVDLMGWYGGSGAGALGAVTPARALDTRPSGRLGGGDVVAVPLAGRYGVPANATAVVLNVTATDAVTDGFLTVFPCANGAPDTSNVNFVTGRAVPNQVLVGLVGGQVCVRTDSPVNVLVDVSGYYAPPPTGTGRFTPITPGRLVDTRQSGSRPGAQTVVTVPALGRQGVPADAVAVSLNVTVDGAGGLGFFTVFPCGTAPPDASNLNYVAGLTVANSVTVGVGAGGAVCVYTEATAHVLVDVTGYYGP